MGVRAHLRPVRSTWDGQCSLIGCKVYIKGKIVKKVGLAVDCEVQEFGSYSGGSGGPLKVSGLRGSLAWCFRESSQESTQDGWKWRHWLGNCVEFWGEAEVWSFPSYCPKARTINFISLGQFPPIKSKGLGQVVLFSSGLV